jgi:hypothetical protein
MKDADLDKMLTEMLDPEKRYIPDDGFTMRVLGNLPAAAPRPIVRYCILTAFTTMAALFGLFIMPGFKAITDAIMESTIALASQRMPPLASLAMVGVVVAAAFVPLGAALRKNL